MKRLFLLAVIFMALASCVKNPGIEGTDAVLDGFDWKTTHAVSISVATPTVDAAYQKYATTIRVYTKPLFKLYNLHYERQNCFGTDSLILFFHFAGFRGGLRCRFIDRQRCKSLRETSGNR